MKRQALETFKRVLEIKPDYPKVVANMGKIYMRHGDGENAVVPTKQCGSIISISYILWFLTANSEKSGVYKVKQGGILKPALLCRDYRKCFRMFYKSGRI